MEVVTGERRVVSGEMIEFTGTGARVGRGVFTGTGARVGKGVFTGTGARVGRGVLTGTGVRVGTRVGRKVGIDVVGVTSHSLLMLHTSKP
jgi:UDP-3-O-[3-hydroxymyristoyl] glucosamine N-acyltransferase